MDILKAEIIGKKTIEKAKMIAHQDVGMTWFNVDIIDDHLVKPFPVEPQYRQHQ